MLRIWDSTDRAAIARLVEKPVDEDRALRRRVEAIVDAVRQEGDRALKQYANRLDGWSGPLEVGRDEMRKAARGIDPALKRALAHAARNIERVARRQLPRGWRMAVAPGVEIEQRVVPLDRVGCYVPGGRYPLPSSLLMTAIPARVAGVREIIAVCPRPEPVVMAAAIAAGVTRLFRLGGAHAVAALAYGTATVPRVDKIVGPGNKWVAAAKTLVSRDCGIDFHAGPTEIVIVAGPGQDAQWIAADLIAQAEHDPDSRAMLITWSPRLATAVAAAVERRAPAGGPTRQSLSHGAIVVSRSAHEAMALANRIAPEHLVVDRESMARGPLCAGAVFVGPYTAQAAGDYATGSNHVLPTSGAARFRGGLSAADFVRVMAVQRLTAHGLAGLAPTIVTLARAEGLAGHARSIEVRRP